MQCRSYRRRGRPVIPSVLRVVTACSAMRNAAAFHDCPGIPPGCERLSLQPFGKRPIAKLAHPREFYEFRFRLLQPARRDERRYPESTHHGPKCRRCQWYCQTKFCRCRAMYGRQSELLCLIGASDGTHGVWIADVAGREGIERSRGCKPVGESE